jgi:hypothetical protein
MMGTFFSIIIAFLILFHPFFSGLHVDTRVLTFIMLGTGIPFLLLIPSGYMFAWGPLQMAERHSTPRIFELFRKDWPLFFANSWIILFSLLTFLLALNALDNNFINATRLYSIWIILLGIAIDTTGYLVRRILSYINPFSVVKIFSRKASESIQNEKELDLCHWIDGLFEIAVKGLEQSSTSLTNLALGEEQAIARLFFESSKSISHHGQDSQTKALGISDKVTYVMFYLYQRLDMAFEKALQHKFEPTCSYILTLFGKISIDAAKYDISMASAPLRFLGKLSSKAQSEGMEESAIKASCTLLEVAKAFFNEIDLTYLEIKDPFLSIINGMELLAKGTFKRDKTSSISILIQPFKELKELFQNEKIRNHPDTGVIVQNIDRILGEFEALQMVMKTIPPLPEISEEIPPQR